MKTILYIAIFFVVLFFAARTTISFNPFRIKLESPYFATGLFLLILGLSFIQYQSRKDGIKEGQKQVIELLENKAEEEQK